MDTVDDRYSREYLSQLRKSLVKYFNVSEIKTLCADLGVDFDVLEGQSKEEKARELIDFLLRRGRLTDLVALCRQERPDIVWRDDSVPGLTQSQGGTILWVDDDHDIISPIVRLLQREGFKIIPVFTVSDALKILRSDTQINLLITDLILPLGTEVLGNAEYSGIDVIAAAREMRVTLPIICLSSAASLWYKAQDYHQAELVAYRALATDALPEFAVQQLKELLRAIWKEETIAV